MNDTDPLVSFIVPAWNAESTLSETIASVAGQSVGKWEIVIVDDGSSDATARIAERWARNDARIRVFGQSNMGFTAARNVGLQHCRGAWISFLDADDLIGRTFVEETAGALDSNSDVDVAVCAWSYLFSDGSVSEPIVFGAGAIANPAARILSCPILFGCAVLRREIAGRFTFDASLKNSGDFLYWFRLAKSGARIVGIPKDLFYYRQVPSSLSRRDPLLCLEQDFEVWNEIERLVPSSELSMVVRRRQVALVSYACRMIAIGKDPWNRSAEAYFPLLAELQSDSLAVSISEFLPIYLSRDPKSWPLIFDQYRVPIQRFLRELRRNSTLAEDFEEAVLLRLEAIATNALMTSVDSSLCDATLLEALRVTARAAPDDRDLGLAPTGGEEPGGPEPVASSRHVRPAQEPKPAMAEEDDRGGSARSASRALLSYTSRRLRSQGDNALPVEIDMRAGRADAALYGAGGWATPEPWGAWTDGPEARLLVALDSESPRDLQVQIDLEHVFCPDPQAPLGVVVEVNREALRELTFGSLDAWSGKAISALVPSVLLESASGMLIVLRIRGASTPKSFGHSEDTRRLGLGVSKIRISDPNARFS